MATIAEKKAGFRSLGDTWADTTTAHGRLMLTVLGGLAEFERELIRARTSEGRARAVANGVKLGRKPILTPHQRREAIKRVNAEKESLGEPSALLTGTAQAVAGVAVGFLIGIVAATLGVAGGELLIPTLVLLFGVDIKLAGGLSLAVSLPTMLVGFARYSRDRSFVVLGENSRFVVVMAVGSIVGSFIGGQLLGLIPSDVLLPLLAVILLVSAVKVWRR
jgi:hypothetical protein